MSLEGGKFSYLMAEAAGNTAAHQQFPVQRLHLPEVMGTCQGVRPALNLVNTLLDTGEPLTTSNDIVHNKPVMVELAERGFNNIGDTWRDLKPGEAIGQRFAVSAHGMAQRDIDEVASKGFEVFNGTCMLVANEDRLIKAAEARGEHVLVIGVDKHPETMSHVRSVLDLNNSTLVERVEDITELLDPNHPRKESELEYRRPLPSDKPIRAFSQTTLMPSDVEGIEQELQAQLGDRLIITKRKDVCPATIDRQAAVEDLATKVPKILVIGSPHSHNSNELKRVAALNGAESFLLDYPDQLQEGWFEPGDTDFGLTAGASVLDRFIEPFIDEMRKLNPNLEVIIHPAPEGHSEGSKDFKLLPETQAKLDQIPSVQNA